MFCGYVNIFSVNKSFIKFVYRRQFIVPNHPPLNTTGGPVPLSVTDFPDSSLIVGEKVNVVISIDSIFYYVFFFAGGDLVDLEKSLVMDLDLFTCC